MQSQGRCILQGGREVTVPRPIHYHNLIWITYVHLVTCTVDPYVHPDAGHTNIRLSLTHTVCPCAVSYARMATWIGAMNHAVLCWTHSQMPYPAQRFFLVTNVPSIEVRVTEMSCSGQRRILISRGSWNIIHFPGRWIGRGSPTSPSPLPWPPRSPELTTPDNSLWGIIKARVAVRRYNNNENLCRAVEDAFRTITPKMLRRMSQRTWRCIRLCVQHQGARTDSLDM